MRHLALIVIFVLTQSLTFLSAQDQSRDYDTGLFEVYLDRSDSSRTRKHWHRWALYGLEAALAEWEAAAVLVLTDPEEREEERALFTGRLEALTSQRLTDWILRNFSQDQGQMDLGSYWEEVRSAMLEESFVMEEGEFLKDEQGDFILLVPADEESWERESAVFEETWLKEMTRRLDSWRMERETFFSELLAGLSPEEQGLLQKGRAPAIASLRESHEREMRKILSLEQSQMARYRLQDRYSLRRKSEDQSAESQTDNIIEDLQEEIADGLQRLQEGLEPPGGEDSADPADIDAERWRESFRQELAKGLDLWNQAEEELLLNRIKWEEQGGVDLAQAQETWREAFAGLAQARDQWYTDYQHILARGQTLWEDQNREMENAVEQARVELQQNVENRHGSLRERVEGLVNILTQSVNMMRTARDNYLFWLGRIPGIRIPPESPWTVSGLRGIYIRELINTLPSLRTLYELEKGRGGSSSTDSEEENEVMTRITAGLSNYLWIRFQEDHPDYLDTNNLEEAGEAFLEKVSEYTQDYADDQRGSLLAFGDRAASLVSQWYTEKFSQITEEGPAGEAFYWLDRIYTDYQEYARGAEKDLLETYGVSVFGQSGLDESGLSGPVPALEGRGWEELFLDEYQVELLKARAVEGFWERELSLAREVLDYARDESSSRATQAETETSYQESLLAYEQALADYQGGLAALTESNGLISQSREGIRDIQAQLSALEEELEAARDEYESKILVLELTSDDFFREEMRELYRELRVLSGFGGDPPDRSIASAYADYLARASSSGGEFFLSGTSQILTELVSPSSGFPGLQSQALRLDSALAWDFEDQWGQYRDKDITRGDFLEGFKTSWSLSFHDRAYLTAQALIDQTPDTPEGEASFRAQFQAMTAGLQQEYQRELESLISQIKLLTTPRVLENARLWAGEEAGSRISQGMSWQEVEEVLQQVQDASSLRFILDQVVFDLGILDDLKGRMDQWTSEGNDRDDFTFLLPGAGASKEEVLSWVYAGSYGPSRLYARLEEDRENLIFLKNALETFSQDKEALKADLRAQTAENPLIDLYLGGMNLFFSRDMDMAAPYRGDDLSRFLQSRQALDHWKAYKNQLPAFYQAFRDQSLEDLENFLTDRGLGEQSGGSLSLKDPEEVWNDQNFDREDAVFDWLSNLEKESGDLFGQGFFPDYLGEVFYLWQQDLTEFFLQETSFLENRNRISPAELESVRRDLDSRLDSLEQNIERMGFFTLKREPVIRLAVFVLNNPGDEELEDILLEALAREMSVRGAPASWEEDKEGHWEDFLDLLELSPPSEVLEVLEARREAVFQRTSALIGDARGRAPGIAALGRLYERLSDWPLEDFAAEVSADLSLGRWSAGAERLPYLKELYGYLETLDSTAAWSEKDAKEALPGSEEDWQSYYDEINSLSPGSGAVLSNGEVMDGFISSNLEEDWAGFTDFSGLDERIQNLYIRASAGALLGALEGRDLLDGNTEGELITWLFGQFSLTTDLDFEDYLDSTENREILLYSSDSQALLFYLKKKALEGDLPQDWESYAAGGDVAELEAFAGMGESRTYLPLLDDSFRGYLTDLGFSFDSLSREETAALDLGIPGRWDDPYFFSGRFLGEDADLEDLLADHLEAKKEGYNRLLFQILSNGEREENEEQVLESSDLTRERMSFYYRERLREIEDTREDAYRQYLGRENFLLEESQYWEGELPGDGQTEEVPGSILVNGLTLDETSQGIYGAGDPSFSGKLESYNVLVLQGRDLLDALEAWKTQEISPDALRAFQDSVQDFQDIPPAGGWSGESEEFLESFTPYEGNSDQWEEYSRAASLWRERLQTAEVLKTSLGRFGRLIAEYRLDHDSRTELLRESKEKIHRVQEEMSALEEQWARVIGDPVVPPRDSADLQDFVSDLKNKAPGELSLREAEYLYSQGYQKVREDLALLEERKQDYKTARAIRDYASSSYLRDDIWEDLEIDNIYLILEWQQLQREISGVDPEDRYTRVYDRYRRAAEAVSMLEEVYDLGNRPPSLYESDPQYADYHDRAGRAKADETAVEGLSSLLIDYLGEKDAAYQTSQQDYEQFLSGFININLEQLTEERFWEILNPSDHKYVLLKRFQVDWDSQGKAEIQFIDPLHPQDDAPLRSEDEKEKILQFFGFRDIEPGKQTYRDVLQEFLLHLGQNTQTVLKDYVGGVSYETLRHIIWKDSVSISTSFYRSKSNFKIRVRHTDRTWHIHRAIIGDMPREYGFDHFLNRAASSIYNEFESRHEEAESSPFYNTFKLMYLGDFVSGNDPGIGSLLSIGQLAARQTGHDKVYKLMNTGWNRFFWGAHFNTLKGKRRELKDSWDDQIETLEERLGDFRREYDKKTSYQEYENIFDKNISLDDLYTYLGRALAEKNREVQEEWARWLGFSPSAFNAGSWKNRLKTYFSTLTASGDFSGSHTPLSLLEELSSTARESRESAGNDKNQYLLSQFLEREEGALREEYIPLSSYGEIKENFINMGLIPPAGFDLEAAGNAWDDYQKEVEKALASSSEDEEEAGESQLAFDLEQRIRDYAAGYIPDEKEAYLVQKNLLKSLEFLDLKYSQGDPDQVIQARVNLFHDFAAVLEAYRLGRTFKALLRGNWHEGDISKREINLDSWLQNKELYEKPLHKGSDLSSLAASQQVPRMFENLNNIYLNRMEAYQEVKNHEMSLQRQEQNYQAAHWQNQMAAILARGQMEWKIGQHRLEKKYQEWQEDFQTAFQDSLSVWEDQTEFFYKRKLDWVEQTTKSVVHLGDQSVLSGLGSSTKDAIAEVSHFIIPDSPAPPDLSRLTGDILNKDLLSSLLGNARGINNDISVIEPAILAGLGNDPYVMGDTLDKIRKFQTEQNEELSARMALVQYEKMLETLEKAMADMEENIADSNQEFQGTMHRMLFDEGFRKSNNNYVKKAIVAATLWEEFFASHVIEAYQHYQADFKDLKGGMVPSEKISLEDLGYTGIQALLDRAMEGLEEEKERIFGGEAVYLFEEAGREAREINFEEYTEGSETVKNRYQAVLSGELNQHIGYAPKFKASPDTQISLESWEKNVLFDGSGEKGRIMGLYRQHMLIEDAAESEYLKPFYEKKLWDDRGIPLKSLSFRGMIDLGASILSSVLPPPLNLVVNLADDLAFGLADLTTGYKDAGEVFEVFGKKALTGVITAGIGALGEVVSNVVGAVGDVLVGTGQTALTQTTSSLINSVDINGLLTGGDGFNERAFTSSFSPIGMTVGMGMKFLSYGLSQITPGVDTNYSVATGLAGAGITAGLEYGLTGRTTLNILNISMFNPGFSHGLLEIHLDKARGVSASLGGRGNNISLDRIGRALKEIQKNRQDIENWKISQEKARQDIENWKISQEKARQDIENWKISQEKAYQDRIMALKREHRKRRRRKKEEEEDEEGEDSETEGNPPAVKTGKELSESSQYEEDSNTAILGDKTKVDIFLVDFSQQEAEEYVLEKIDSLEGYTTEEKKSLKSTYCLMTSLAAGASRKIIEAYKSGAMPNDLTHKEIEEKFSEQNIIKPFLDKLLEFGRGRFIIGEQEEGEKNDEDKQIKYNTDIRFNPLSGFVGNSEEVLKVLFESAGIDIEVTTQGRGLGFSGEEGMKLMEEWRDENNSNIVITIGKFETENGGDHFVLLSKDAEGKVQVFDSSANRNASNYIHVENRYHEIKIVGPTPSLQGNQNDPEESSLTYLQETGRRWTSANAYPIILAMEAFILNRRG